MGLSAAASISLTQARPHMGTACPQDEHSSLTSSSGTLKGSFGGDRFAIPQNAVTSQHVAYEAVSKMSTLQSDSSTASTGSVNQNIEDKDHQKDDVEMFDGKDHVMFIDGQRSERGGFQRNTGQAQLAQCVQKRKPSPQAGFSFSAILTSPQKGSSNKNSDETQKLRNFEERPATPQSEGSIDTLDKYAFNFHRDAYDHQVPRHLITGVSVHVSKLAIKTSLDQHYHTAQEKGLADVCPPLVPHEHELQELDFNNIPCIWVGMCLSPQRRDQDNAARLQTSNDANGEGSSKKPSKKKAKLASIADLSEDDMRILPFDPNALRVVVKKGDKTTRCWPTYALLNPNQDNLCEGFTVPAEGVYFFKQFRDDKAKSFSARLGAMRAKVRTKMFPAGTPKEIGDVILDRMREEIARAKEASNTTAQDSVQKSLHGDERSPSTDTTLEELTVDFEGGPTFDELMADLESDGVGDLDLDCDEYGNTAYSGKGRDEEAYPEHAVAATDANYMEYENDLIGRFLQTNSKAALKGSGSRYSEKGQDNNNNDQGVIERDEGTQPISPSSLCSDGYAGADEQEPVSTVQPQAVGLARRMIEMVEELAAQGDVAALRQGCRMLDCLKTRSVPPRTGALGLYLNVPIDDTNDPSFSPPMLDELLVSTSPFPPPLRFPMVSSEGAMYKY